MSGHTLVDTRRRIVRSPQMEAWLAFDHRPTPHSPRFDVEQLDADGRVSILATGITIEQARKLCPP